jgi:cyclophilin family peptidyl-prolyl cis-trans isomerase
VDNFLGYVNSGFYDYLLFHRIMPGFVIQGGSFYYDGSTFHSRTPAPPIVNESYNGLSNVRGTIAMARLPDPNSANSQFFINLVDNSSSLDRAHAADHYGYCVFGQVVQGMDVVDAIAQVPTCNRSSWNPAFTNFPCNQLIGIYSAYVLPCSSPDCSNFNSDTKVNFQDFAFFASQWLNSGCNSANNFCQQRDLNYDGFVDVDDLTIFVNNWLWGTIPADIDIDGNVDFIDYAHFASHWMEQNCSSSDWCGHADFDRSGQVDMSDLEILISNWLVNTTP